MPRFVKNLGNSIEVAYGYDVATQFFLDVTDYRLEFESGAPKEVNSVTENIGIKDGGGSYFNLHTGPMGFGLKVTNKAMCHFLSRYGVDKNFRDKCEKNIVPTEADAPKDEPKLSFSFSSEKLNHNTPDNKAKDLNDSLGEDDEVLFNYASSRKLKGNEYFKKLEYKRAIKQYLIGLAHIEALSLIGIKNNDVFKLQSSFHLNLAVCYLKLNNAQTAIANAQMAYNLMASKPNLFKDTDRAKARYRQALGHMHIFEFTTARPLLEAASSLAPKDAEIKRQLTTYIAIDHLKDCVTKDTMPTKTDCLKIFMFDKCIADEKTNLLGVYIGAFKILDIDIDDLHASISQSRLVEYLLQAYGTRSSKYIVWLSQNQSKFQ